MECFWENHQWDWWYGEWIFIRAGTIHQCIGASRYFFWQSTDWYTHSNIDTSIFLKNENDKNILCLQPNVKVIVWWNNSGKAWLMLCETSDCSLGPCIWGKRGSELWTKFVFIFKFEGLNPFDSLFTIAKSITIYIVSCLWYRDTYRIGYGLYRPSPNFYACIKIVLETKMKMFNYFFFFKNETRHFCLGTLKLIRATWDQHLGCPNGESKFWWVSNPARVIHYDGDHTFKYGDSH
jgi:hypothetical protein